MTDYKNIVPKARGGDPKALDELYKSTNRAVYFTCLCLLKNEQDAEDLTQNTYITAFGKLQTLKQPDKFEPWIKRIAANLCKDFLYKKGAHPSEPLDEESYADTDENFLPDEYITAAEKRSIVMQIMRESLSDVLYQTVIMFYFDEMSVAEIAEAMNCPEGTVKYRLNAARAKIKKGVLDYEKESGDRLYAFVGLPGSMFLARLLAKEAEAAGVPALDIMSVITHNSPYVPDSTAVDPNFTANPVKRIGGKMLGTLKAKIIAGAAAAAVVGGGVTAAVLIANNSADNSYTSSPAAYSSSSTPTASDSKPNIDVPGVDYSKSRFWFARQTWDEPPRTTFEGGVLADKRDIHDVDLHKIDGISAPYSAVWLVEKDEDGHYLADKIEDCLNSQYIIEPSGNASIETQYYKSGELPPPFDGLEEIMVFNFDDEPRTAAYCFEQNWWKNYIGVVQPDETRALGLDHELKKTGPAPREDELLDAVKAKFGTPHYIRFGSLHEDEQGLDPKTALFNEVKREFDASYDGIVGAFYDMIYDYGDILMVLFVHEQLVGENTITDLVQVEFWRRECWEHRTDIKPFYGGENDSEQMFSPYEGEYTEPPAPVNNSSEPEQNDSPFWFARQTWNEAPRKTFEGGILADNRKTLDLRQIDSISAPYFSSILYSTDKTTDKFSDVWYNPREVDTYDIIEVETRVADEIYEGLGMIQIFNFDNIPHPIEDCLENGWWKSSPAVSGAFLYETTALGLDSSLSRNGEEYVYEEELVNEIIKKFGTPHYICYPWRVNGSKNPDRRAAMNEDMELVLNPVAGAEIHFIQYQFVYELENDVVMTVTISESLNDDGRITLNVDYVEFWSGACWENRNTVMNMDQTLDNPWDEIELFTVYEP